MGIRRKSVDRIIIDSNLRDKFTKRRTLRQRIARWTKCIQLLRIKFWEKCSGVESVNEQNIIHIEELEKLEYEGMLLKARAYLDRTHMLFLFAGTAFASTFTNFQFWLSLSVFCGARFSKNFENPLPDLCSVAVSISIVLAQWTLVFYVNNCFERFNIQYKFCMSSSETIIAFCSVARTCLSKTGQWRLFRHLNASCLLTYIGIGNEYSEDSLFIPENERHCLLTPMEVSRIEEIGFKGPAAYREVLTWAMLSIQQEYTDGHLTEHEMKTLSSHVLSLRGSLARLFHFADFPIPFSYRHLIHFLAHVFLTIFALSVGYSNRKSQNSYLKITDSILECIFVLFITTAALSIVQLGKRIQDPFGHDKEDLPVVHFINSVVRASYRTLCGPEIQNTSQNNEIYLFNEREGLGKCFLFHYGDVGVRKKLIDEDFELEVFEFKCIAKSTLPKMQTIHVRRKKKTKSKKNRKCLKVHPIKERNRQRSITLLDETQSVHLEE